MPVAAMRQVFMWPGAIRWVRRVSGKPASHCSVALSIVSHATGSPVCGSGRSVTMSLSWAKTVAGRQPSRSGRWATCIPRSPITPIAPQ